VLDLKEERHRMSCGFPLFVVFGAALGSSALLGCAGSDEEHLDPTAPAGPCAGDAIVTQEHFVQVSNGATLHVVEKYAGSALDRDPPKAVLMLPATLVTNLLWNASISGYPEYDGLERAARAGYFAYTLDYEGYGASSKPADGKAVDMARLTRDAGEVVQWIRERRRADQIDVIGSSLGSSIAAALGSTASPILWQWIGHVVATANVYKTVTPLMSQQFFTPANEARLEAAPGGYIPTAPTMYGLVLVAADPVAQGYCLQRCPGVYAVGPTLAGFHLPDFDAGTGRAPLLQFWGDHDLVTPFSDVEQFQAEYGGPRSVVVLEGGAHVPQWEPVRDRFWADTFAFLDDEDHAGDDPGSAACSRREERRQDGRR
jgi:pimeloyl-ACP methyl ester carboxylesterase